MFHFLIHPDGQRWRWTFYAGPSGTLRSPDEFVDRAACEASVRAMQRVLRCPAICYAGIPEDEA